MKNFVWFFLILTCSATGQEIKWQTSDDWKLYGINNEIALRYSVDTLANFPFVEINRDSVLLFLKGAKSWVKGKTSMWMGAYYATCVIAGVVHKIDISVYGGFFYDEMDKHFYQVPLHLIDKWKEWLIVQMKRINVRN